MASDKEDMVLASSRSSQGKVESKDQSSTGSSNANVNDTTDSGIDEQGHDFLSMSDEGTDLDKYLERLDVSSSEDDDTTSLEYVTATADYEGQDKTQLSFEKGARIVILSKETDDWWWGENDGNCGYVPVNHICAVSSQNGVLQDWQDDDYYQSYGKLGLQLEMLADKPRTLTYLKAIKSNRSYLKDKVILDVGCGTGILSLFCVKYGHARKVYAVEASDSALFAKNIIAENGFTDKIFVINNKIEELSDAIKEEVDLIISEWMGTLLISEFMIESVICARNLYLKADGKMFPSAASLHIVPYSAKSAYNDNLLFWDDVYGFKFKSVKQHATEEIFGKPMHNFIAQTDNFLAKPQKVTNLNMASITPADLEHIESDCSFTMSKSGQVHGFCTWFSVEFESLCSESTAVILNTGPNSPLTHWKHPLLMLDSPLNVKIGDEIRIKFIMTRNVEMRRHLIIKIIGIFQDNLTQNKSLSFSKEYFCWQ